MSTAFCKHDSMRVPDFRLSTFHRQYGSWKMQHMVFRYANEYKLAKRVSTPNDKSPFCMPCLNTHLLCSTWNINDDSGKRGRWKESDRLTHVWVSPFTRTELGGRGSNLYQSVASIRRRVCNIIYFITQTNARQHSAFQRPLYLNCPELEFVDLQPG